MMVMPGNIKFIDAYILTRFLLQEHLGMARGDACPFHQIR
jgi:hypothetical protein